MEPVTTNPPLQVTIPPRENLEQKQKSFWSGEAPSFTDLLDTVNPLQHIPLVSNLYQQATGDNAPSTGARLAGGALFGGPLGFLASLMNVIVEQETGNDLAGHAFTAVTGSGKPEQVTHVASTMEPFVSASRASAINAYVSVQRWTAAA